MAVKVLKMNFRTEEGRSVSVNLSNPVDNPPEADVSAAMEMVVNNDIFNTSSGSITEKVNAVVITTQTDEIVNFEE